MARIEAYLMRPRDRPSRVQGRPDDPGPAGPRGPGAARPGGARVRPGPRQLGQVLREAVAAGELPATSTPSLAHTLMAVLQGGYVLAIAQDDQGLFDEATAVPSPCSAPRTATPTTNNKRRRNLMTVRIGINGFGRIGRSYLRAALTTTPTSRWSRSTTSPTPVRWPPCSSGTPSSATSTACRSRATRSPYGARIRVFAQPDPAAIAWGDVRATSSSSPPATSRTRPAAAHLKGGARKVIISAPAKGDVPTFVLGVNDDQLDPDSHDVFSNGSCTTNSLAPLAKVLNDSFGIESGLMTTIHAYTGDQRLHDAPHSDLRRARAAAVSTIPTSSGAAKAIGQIIPELDGRLTGAALRVPVPVGSITDLTVVPRQRAVDDVNAAFREAAASRAAPYLQYSEAPLVSADIVGNPYSSIFDAPLTEAVGNQVKVFGWYDNEWGFSNRLVELSERIVP